LLLAAVVIWYLLEQHGAVYLKVYGRLDGAGARLIAVVEYREVSTSILL